MFNRNQILTVAVLLLIAFSAGRFSSPKSIQTKETDKITTETQKNIDKNQNVTQDTKETKLPDGTVITETHKTIQTATETQTKRDSETIKDLSTTIENRPSFRLGAIYEPAVRNFQDTSYGVILEKRLFSEVYMGVEASSRKTVGLTLSLGF